eukprot:1056089_1
MWTMVVAFVEADMACRRFAEFHLSEYGDIETLDEYKYHIKRGLSASAGMGIGNWGGTVAGATLGSIGGPIGAIIGGILGGLLGGILGAKAGRKLFENHSPDDFIYREQRRRDEENRAALRLFGWLDVNVIADPEKFNEKEIQKRYRRLAKQYHPDRNGGTPESHANFHTLNASLGCLMALLAKKNKKEVIKKMRQIPAISYLKNIERAKRVLREKRLLYIVTMCHQYDVDLTLEDFCRFRMNDILELIDEMNDDEGNDRRIPVRKKNTFARVLSQKMPLKMIINSKSQIGVVQCIHICIVSQIVCCACYMDLKYMQRYSFFNNSF